jgi:hypothetical protein
VRRALATLVLATIALVGCGPGPATTPKIDSPVDGVVIAVDAASLTNVNGFTLRIGMWSLDFKLGPLENATSFSPSHLKEHQATSEPIRVWFRMENGERVAYRIEDAPG